MFAGALGGSFSSLLRLQRTSMSGNAVVNLWKLDSMGVSAILSPFVGALSAILLLFLFTGHFIEGQLFPRVSFVNNCELCAVCSTNVAQTTSLSNNIPSMADMPLLASSLTLTNPQEILNKTNTTDSATNNPTSPKPEIVSANGKKQLESPWPYHFCIPFGFELAKLLIWCFIAGFSERLVPDIIDRLGEKAKN
jgi:phosphate/sulfate permease